MEDIPKIIPYQNKYEADFREINYEWLENFFRVTALDKSFLIIQDKKL